MAQKKLQKDSEYNKYDLDGDGIVTDEEMNAIAKIEEIEMQEEKAKPIAHCIFPMKDARSPAN